MKPHRRFLLAVNRFVRRRPLGAVGGGVTFTILLIAIFAPYISPFDPLYPNVEFIFAPPGGEYFLGGDQLGRDVLSRLMWGARISMYVGVACMIIGVPLGAFLGIVSAYFGGTTDLIIQRLVDAAMAFPGLILALAIVSVLGASTNNVIIALVVVFIPGVSRTVRSQALSIKETDYILAARALGAGDWRIIFRHMAPNLASIYLVLAPITLAWAIIVEASLSFLGVGVPPDIPSWGGMLTGAAQQYIALAPWLGIFPGLAVAITVFAVNLFGDALRDALDPRLRGTAGGV